MTLVTIVEICGGSCADYGPYTPKTESRERGRRARPQYSPAGPAGWRTGERATRIGVPDGCARHLVRRRKKWAGRAFAHPALACGI